MSAPQARDGSALRWLVVNPDGKLLAVLDSESEAYWFTRNWGHANGAVYIKAPIDYAAAPDLLESCKDLLRHAQDLLKASEGIDGLTKSRLGLDSDIFVARQAIDRAEEVQS